MSKSLIIVSVLLTMFLLNIILYNASENYRFFIKKIKNPEEIVYVDETQLDDSSDVVVNEPSQDIIVQPTAEEIEILKSATIVGKNDSQPKLSEIAGQQEPTQTVILGSNYQNILDIFDKYNLGKLQLKSTLFDITDEYPDDYHEYYSKNLTLYLFPTKTYQDLKDIFRVQPELPIEINEVNNFGDNSFFINLVPTDENTVRLVVNYKSSVFGLKIKKDEYNKVKQILNNLQ